MGILSLIFGKAMLSITMLVTKLPYVFKTVLALVMVTTGAATLGLPLHDPWFDIVLVIMIGSIVGGEPEPDQIGKMTALQFLYLWGYRSSHLFISAATAYMIHPNKWKDISTSVGKPEINE